mmetsp:Transcript_38698/g.66914  ORF Transcript_38698/g.66914 Transcript_38698/m.66914 type:complete len:213 (-) Transcript_38698:113-751(-)
MAPLEQAPHAPNHRSSASPRVAPRAAQSKTRPCRTAGSARLHPYRPVRPRVGQHLRLVPVSLDMDIRVRPSLLWARRLLLENLEPRTGAPTVRHPRHAAVRQVLQVLRQLRLCSTASTIPVTRHRCLLLRTFTPSIVRRAVQAAVPRARSLPAPRERQPQWLVRRRAVLALPPRHTSPLLDCALRRPWAARHVWWTRQCSCPNRTRTPAQSC